MAHEGEFASSGKLRKRELLCHRVINAPFLQRCMRIDCSALDGGSMVHSILSPLRLAISAHRRLKYKSLGDSKSDSNIPMRI
jgi:hypothetical protein